MVGSFVVRKSDSAIIASSTWDEGGHEAVLIKNGVTQNACINTHGWGASGAGQVAANTDHIYVGLKLNGEQGAQGRHDMVAPPVGTS